MLLPGQVYRQLILSSYAANPCGHTVEQTLEMGSEYLLASQEVTH
jgi:hypothetical protein